MSSVIRVPLSSSHSEARISATLSPTNNTATTAATVIESAPHAQPQIVFTRQLWERTMPRADANEHMNDSSSSSDKNSRIGSELRNNRIASTISVVTAAANQSQSQAQSQRPSPKARLSEGTPLTPEESPPFHQHNSNGNHHQHQHQQQQQQLRQHHHNQVKRSADHAALDDEDASETISPSSHTRDNSAEESSASSSVTFCLCQPEPKVPRPRNAFILYRQNRQAAVVAQNPGFANPEISKIIGEQWRNEPELEKNRWKAYAEEEKLQHQQRFPLYRYQPKRSGRRGSVSSESGLSQSDHRKCQKCGGRTTIHPTPSTPSSAREKPQSLDTSPSSSTSAYPHPSRLSAFQLPPPTPSSTTTPSTRYLPMLNNLSLASPHPRSMSNARPPQSFMTQQRAEDDHPSTLSLDAKRRRFESPQGTYVMATRTMPPRQNAGPGTPFPFGSQGQHPMQQGQQMMPPHQYPPPPGTQHLRRESLPHPAELLRGPVPPNMMGPPPRPGSGYSQHRAAQGQRPGGPELSLTLPPLQAGNLCGPPTGSRAIPNQPLSGSRGSESREPDLRSVGETIMSMSFMAKIQILGRVAPPSPSSDMNSNNNKSRGCIIAIEGDNAEAARSVTDWLEEFLKREGDVVVKVIDGPKLPENDDGHEVQFPELLQTVAEWHAKSKEIERLVRGSGGGDKSRNDSDVSFDSDDEGMEVDSAQSGGSSNNSNSKLVVLLRTFTVTASNVFASRIAIRDAYKAADHWQWTATLWRGIVGPDMTVYVKEEDGGKGGVEIKEENRIMAVRRFKGCEDKGGVDGIEAGALRRLGFEVGEWVRSGGGVKRE